MEVESSQAGSWCYQCTGEGLDPKPSAPIAMSTAIGQQTSCSVNWQNPFQSPVKAEIKLVLLDAALPASKKADSFELLGRKQPSIVHVAPGASVQIAIGYTASAMQESLAELQVMALLDDPPASPHGITWRYPLKVRARVRVCMCVGWGPGSSSQLHSMAKAACAGKTEVLSPSTSDASHHPAFDAARATFTATS